jgi:hypothetical protein
MKQLGTHLQPNAVALHNAVDLEYTYSPETVTSEQDASTSSGKNMAKKPVGIDVCQQLRLYLKSVE